MVRKMRKKTKVMSDNDFKIDLIYVKFKFV